MERNAHRRLCRDDRQGEERMNDEAKTVKDASDSSSLSPDEPIQSKDDDLLARGRVVDVLSEHIMASDPTEAIVIAVNAPWGAGKSSFLNLLEARLVPNKTDKAKPKNEPVIIKFHAWNYRCILQIIWIIGRFTIMALFKIYRVLKALCDAGISFIQYVAEITFLPYENSETNSKDYPIVIRFNPWHYNSVEQLVRMFFDEIARGIGDSNSAGLGKKIGKLLNVAGEIASVYPIGTGSVLKSVGSMLQDEKMLSEIKTEIKNLLPKLNRRVIVFIDDIDRLETDALRILVRMIRLNADFPNVTYVLAFDRLVVEHLLEENLGNPDQEKGVRGRDYLDKIVQLSFALPEPEPESIINILLAMIDAALKPLKIRALDKHRWGNVFNSGFKNHFRTIRDIKRYSNGLRVRLAPISQDVDLVDFLAIELIRLFHPEIYHKIAQEKNMLAPEATDIRDEMQAEKIQNWLDEICGESSIGFRDHTKELLCSLFPELDSVYRNFTYGDSLRNEWRKECRVCSPETFYRFFSLAIPDGDISETEMTDFVNNLGNVYATSKTLRNALTSGKARRLLVRFQDYTDEIQTEQVAPLISVLFDLGDFLRFESQGMLDIEADRLIPWTIWACVCRLETQNEQFEILLKSIQEGSALYTVVQVVSLLEDKIKNPDDRMIIDHSQWEALRDAALCRIDVAYKDGSLWELKHLAYVLFRWLEWTNEKVVQDAVATRIDVEENLISFLERFVQFLHSEGDGDKVSRVHRKIEKNSLQKLLDLDVVTKRIKGIASGGGEQSSAASDLLSLIESKPEFPWDD